MPLYYIYLYSTAEWLYILLGYRSLKIYRKKNFSLCYHVFWRQILLDNVGGFKVSKNPAKITILSRILGRDDIENQIFLCYKK